ncbi:hypothetical protein QZH41_020783 [Actinostola sp. cb2023]|nr:hypothetical protein QZH41_020783 [Actinostola sp. cb2023]
MPRGGRRSSGRSSPIFGKPTPKSVVPARPPPSSVAGPAQPRQPGMLGQIASTAAGVAIGSTVGHVVGGALMGGHGSSDNQAADQASYQQQSGQQQQNPCHFELEQFVQCAQDQSDMSYCQGFNQVLKQCKLDHGK